MNIIFDFDGVIGNSLPSLVRIANEQFSKRLHEPLSVELIRAKGVKRLFAEYRINSIRLLIWVWIARRKLSRETIPMFEGMKQVLGALHSRGHVLNLVSSGGKEYVYRTLSKENCLDYFQIIKTNIGVFHKARYLRQFVGQNQNIPMYVGDEVRDIEAAHRVGMKCTSVTWGYESRAVLQESNPDYLVETPEALLNIVQNMRVDNV